jgi:hypothetical protein
MILSIILIVVFFLIGIIWGIIIGARKATSVITSILYYQNRMKMEEVKKYCEYSEIIKMLNKNYVNDRIKYSKGTPSYWQIGIQANRRSGNKNNRRKR